MTNISRIRTKRNYKWISISSLYLGFFDCFSFFWLFRLSNCMERFEKMVVIISVKCSYFFVKRALKLNEFCSIIKQWWVDKVRGLWLILFYATLQLKSKCSVIFAYLFASRANKSAVNGSNEVNRRWWQI